MSPKLFEQFEFTPHTRVLVAVSGGVDSMVLLDLAVRAPNLDVVVATFDHRLRPESRQEQAFVAAAAARYHVPVVTGTWQRSAATAVSEAAARQARYDFLNASADSQAATVIMTAHHADDQLETVLFRLGRSGDPAALVGIRPDQPWRKKRLVRPLLNFSKDDIRAYAGRHGLDFCDDPSNADTRYARNQLRHQVIPAFKKQNPELLRHVQRFTTEQSGLVALAQMQLTEWQQRLRINSVTIDWRAAANQPRTIQLMLLATLLRQWQPRVNHGLLMPILKSLNDTRERRFDLGAGVTIAVQAAKIVKLVPKPKLAPATFSRIGQKCQTARGTFQLQTKVAGDQGIPVRVRLPITLRTRQAGDIVYLPNGVKQKLRRFFINAKVPARTRDQLLVLAQGHQIFWIEGQPLERLSLPAQTDILHVVLVKLPDVDRSEDK